MSGFVKKFDGFDKGIFKFFSDLEKNNNLSWFAKNRNRYQEVVVKPAREYVEAIGEFFNHLNPAIRTEPKFNKTLMRINKDMRFAKGDPYKTYFLIHFGRFKMDSEFFVYFDKYGMDYGLFLNNSIDDDLYFNQNLSSYGKEIVNVFNKYELSNRFDLCTFDKDIDLVRKKANLNKHFDVFSELEYILLQKSFEKKQRKITSANFLIESIKTFSKLYPIYCFAISPNPLKLIQDFEERMGVAH